MHNRAWIVCAGLVLGLVGPGWAAADSPRYSVDRSWTIDDGLPQSSILSLAQSRDGYLWLGTLEGLVRFDGVGHKAGALGAQFPVFDESNTPGLNASRILRVFEDSHGDLWIGTETAGVVVVDPNGKLTHLDSGQGNHQAPLVSICEDRTGAVWLYSSDGQLSRFHNRQVDVWNEADPPLGTPRTLIAEDSGLIWVGTDRVLSGFDPARVSERAPLPVAYRQQLGKLDYLLASRRGGYWRFAEGRVQKWKVNQLERDLAAYAWLDSLLIAAACEDAQGNLIVGTYGAGVFWFDGEGKAAWLSGVPNTNQYIVSLLTDREGNLWVGTDGDGLSRVKRQVFDVLPGSLGLTVQSVCDDGQGGLWVGYNSPRVDHWNPTGQETFEVGQAGVNLAVRAVFADRQGTVWVGAQGQGAGLFQLQAGRFERVPGFDAVANPQVSAIHQDRRGQLWVGTRAGLARWDGRNWSTLSTLDGLSAAGVQVIADDPAGVVWVGTDTGGLNRWRDGRFTCFTKTNGLPSANISALLADEHGVWVGTASGLARLQEGRAAVYTTRDGLVGNSIRYILDDGQGGLWIGSNAGLMRVGQAPPTNSVDRLGGPLSVRVYEKSDGLPTGECTQGSQPAACQTRDGKYWFCTTKGLASLNPALLYTNSQPPPVIIESVSLQGSPVQPPGLHAPPPQTVTVPAGKEGLQIDFTSLNLGAPDKGSFKYRLEGHEKGWSEVPASVRSVRYGKLPPGHYRFRLTACNEDGVWNPAESVLSVVVRPPFWQTWWFISGSAVFLLGLITGSVHYVSTQRLQRQLAALRQQEAIEQERARIARDLHDQLGANLTQVALLGELAETDKDHPQDIEAHARQICQTARETTRALDEIVWTVNPANDTLDGLVNYLCKYAQDYLAVAGLRYRLEVPDHLPNTPISPELRHNVFLAAKESFNNIVKHAQASSTWLRLRFEPNQFVLEIQDDGRGLGSGQKKPDRSGLRNLRQRMEAIGGNFAIEPGDGGGTVVRLTAPLASSPLARTDTGA